MDNKTAIINYWWDTTNYGANLTAYAIQQILLSLQMESKLINNISGNFKKISKKIFALKTFEKEYLSVSDFINSYEDFKVLNDNFDNFLVGSDQVFRPKTNGKDRNYQYLLDFVNINKKKIAISASFGVDKEQFLKETPEKIIEKMKRALQTFDFISVREKSGIEICRNLFDVNAKWIIDPVFILNKTNYENLFENSKQDFKDKIISYVFNKKRKYIDVHKYLSKKYNVEVVDLFKNNEPQVSIEDWLKAIKECKLLITNSFHGMCFAIIFNKPFICIVNSETGITRYSSVFEMLEIENQCIENPLEIMKRDCIFKVDYEKVNANIEKQRQIGLEYLKKALEAPVCKQKEKLDAKIAFLEEKICEMEEELTLKNLIKKELWNKWLVIYHCYLPKFIKNIISYFWQKRKNKCK